MGRPSVRNEGQLLQSMVAHWIHEDQLYWSQVRYALTVQLAVFIPWYQLKHRIEGIVLCFIAVILTITFFFLAQAIRINRDVNLEKIKSLSCFVANECIFADDSGSVQKSECRSLFYFTSHSLTKEDFSSKPDKGLVYQLLIFGFFIAIDIVLIFYGSIEIDLVYPVQPYL